MDTYNLIIEPNEPKDEKFTIIWANNTPKGAFYVFRFLWHSTANGKTGHIIIFNLILFVFLALAVVFDILLILLFALWTATKYIVKETLKFLKKLVYKFFTILVYPTLKTLIKSVSFIVLIIILIFKFEFIKNIILTTFNNLIK